MHIRFIIVVIAGLISFSGFAQDTSILDAKHERHVEVVMRSIGHQVMIAHGDHTSRILPIERIDDQFSIRFGTEFRLNSSKLIFAVDSIVKSTEIAHHYLVAMRDCDTEEILYSFEVDGMVDLNTIPCGTREQPLACYNLLFTIMDDHASMIAASNENPSSELSAASSDANWILMAIPFLLVLGIVLYYKRKKPAPTDDPNIIEIGQYQFDKRNMILSLADNSTELTSKEADLLELLQSSANTTIERDDILRHVWGDKGDYVGRTLDVFISKLRKKLEGDPAVKIANIRGVGYRLVVN